MPQLRPWISQHFPINGPPLLPASPQVLLPAKWPRMSKNTTRSLQFVCNRSFNLPTWLPRIHYSPHRPKNHNLLDPFRVKSGPPNHHSITNQPMVFPFSNHPIHPGDAITEQARSHDSCSSSDRACEGRHRENPFQKKQCNDLLLFGLAFLCTWRRG